MTLRMLLNGVDIEEQKGNMDTEITGIAYDSRNLGKGFLYVALKGQHLDGNDFIEDAIDRGAGAVISERSDGLNGKDVIPFIRVRDAREALAFISNNFYRRPSESLTVVGVTGTNGKTTVTRIIKSILEADGKSVGLIGTINYIVGQKTFPAPYTTPESVEFQHLLSEMLGAGCSHVVAEVSSHALSQRRVDGTMFDVAVFTNLTQDHLDFHGDMESYFVAKRRLFDELLSGPAVLNVDDPYGAKLLSSVDRPITYGIESEADLTARDVENTSKGLSFTCFHRKENYAVESSLLGRPNVYNILAAIGAGLAGGVSWETIRKGIRDAHHVEGRFERINMGQNFLCLVDYAHTEDALRNLITTAREFTKGRIITVFGCGGNRDTGKRPAMGAVATKLSEMVFITTDNPRSEDPNEIIRQIVSGVQGENYRVVPDRAQAISEAIKTAREHDTVLIAGKGHEDYQEINGKRFRFSDKEIAGTAINEKIGRA